MDNRSLDLLVKIVLEIDEIEARKAEFHIDEELWSSSRAMRDLVLMPLIQIGELITHFPDNGYLSFFPQVPWREIKGFRNVVVHGYGQIDPNIAWETATNGIEKLKSDILDNAEVAQAYRQELEYRTALDESGESVDGLDSLIDSLPSAE